MCQLLFWVWKWIYFLRLVVFWWSEVIYVYNEYFSTRVSELNVMVCKYYPDRFLNWICSNMILMYKLPYIHFRLSHIPLPDQLIKKLWQHKWNPVRSISRRILQKKYMIISWMDKRQWHECESLCKPLYCTKNDIGQRG